jgi:DNA-binding transcriptional MocR family regulator
LLARLQARLPEWKVRRPEGGLSLWAELPSPVSSALAATSERFGVRIAAGPRFGVDGAFERFVRLPYTLAPEDLTTSVERLAAAYDGLRAGATPTRASIGAVV